MLDTRTQDLLTVDGRYAFSVFEQEEIISCAIRKAGPSMFRFFSICPVDKAATVLGASTYRCGNVAYEVLDAYHCCGRREIPRCIRKRIPQLIREALTFEREIVK